MANYFWDASALVKYYVTEPGSTWVRHLLDSQDIVTTSPLHVVLVAEITRVEVAAGIAVIERTGRIRRRERQREYSRFISEFLHRYVVIGLSSETVKEAAELTQRHPPQSLRRRPVGRGVAPEPRPGAGPAVADFRQRRQDAAGGRPIRGSGH